MNRRQSDPGPDRRARYEAVFGEVYEPLQRYVLRRAPATVADDVVAEALIVLWRRLDDVPADAVLAWTYGVARRCLANERRGAGRRANLVERIKSDALVPVGAPNDDPALDAALARLSDDDRELLRLWAWEELAPREIAVVLGVSANAVSIRLHRARAQLAEALAGKDAARAGHTVVGHIVQSQSEEAP